MHQFIYQYLFTIGSNVIKESNYTRSNCFDMWMVNVLLKATSWFCYDTAVPKNPRVSTHDSAVNWAEFKNINSEPRGEVMIGGHQQVAQQQQDVCISFSPHVTTLKSAFTKRLSSTKPEKMSKWWWHVFYNLIWKMWFKLRACKMMLKKNQSKPRGCVK